MISTGERHGFRFWPGLSLNPGLWDLRSIMRTYSSVYIHEEDQHNHGYGAVEVFDALDGTFEHKFTIEAHVAGLRMAYLSGSSVFDHIGDKVSAYALNGFKRPWD